MLINWKHLPFQPLKEILNPTKRHILYYDSKSWLILPFPPWTNIMQTELVFLCELNLEWFPQTTSSLSVFRPFGCIGELCFPSSHNSIDGWNKWTMTKPTKTWVISLSPVIPRVSYIVSGMMHTKSVFISSIDSQDHQISITHDGSMGLVNSPHIFSLICMVNGKCK